MLALASCIQMLQSYEDECPRDDRSLVHQVPVEEVHDGAHDERRDQLPQPQAMEGEERVLRRRDFCSCPRHVVRWILCWMVRVFLRQGVVFATGCLNE